MHTGAHAQCLEKSFVSFAKFTLKKRWKDLHFSLTRNKLETLENKIHVHGFL